MIISPVENSDMMAFPPSAFPEGFVTRISPTRKAGYRRTMQLIIGNKNYSSWSFRPWLAMKVAGIAFEETLISLEAPDFKKRVTALGGAGRVPTLIDGNT